MTLTVHLPDDLERRLQERASRDGRAVEDYVLKLIETDAAGTEGGQIVIVDASDLPPRQDPTLPDSEFDRLLNQLAAGTDLPHLPADFSRADIYSDHD